MTESQLNLLYKLLRFWKAAEEKSSCSQQKQISYVRPIAFLNCHLTILQWSTLFFCLSLPLVYGWASFKFHVQLLWLWTNNIISRWRLSVFSFSFLNMLKICHSKSKYIAIDLKNTLSYETILSMSKLTRLAIIHQFIPYPFKLLELFSMTYFSS